MDPLAAKYFSIAIATISMAVSAVALSAIFSTYLSGAFRNPSAAESQFVPLVLAFAVTEAIGIFCLLVALLLLFAG